MMEVASAASRLSRRVCLIGRQRVFLTVARRGEMPIWAEQGAMAVLPSLSVPACHPHFLDEKPRTHRGAGEVFVREERPVSHLLDLGGGAVMISMDQPELAQSEPWLLMVKSPRRHLHRSNLGAGAAG